MSVPMQALKGFPYAGRRLAAGDNFEARGESDARVLVAIGKAKRSAPVALPPLPDLDLPPAVAPKRGRGNKALQAAAPVALMPDPAGVAQATEQGTADTPGAGTAEAAPASASQAPARRQYKRRDLAGAPE